MKILAFPPKLNVRFDKQFFFVQAAFDTDIVCMEEFTNEIHVVTGEDNVYTGYLPDQGNHGKLVSF